MKRLLLRLNTIAALCLLMLSLSGFDVNAQRTVTITGGPYGGALAGAYVEAETLLNEKPYFVLSDPSNAYDGQIAITWNTSTLASGLTEAWELNFLSGGTGQPFAYNGADTDLVPQNGWDDSTIGLSGDGTEDNFVARTVTITGGPYGGALAGTYVEAETLLNEKPYFVLSDPSNAYDGQIAITWNTSTLASGLTEAWELNFLSGGTGQPFAYNGADTDLVPQNGWDDSTIGLSGDGTEDNFVARTVTITGGPYGGALAGTYVEAETLLNEKPYFVLSDPSNAYDGQIAITWNTSTLASGLTEAWELNFLSGGTGQPFAYNGADTDLVPQNGWDDSTMGVSGDGTEDNFVARTVTITGGPYGGALAGTYVEAETLLNEKPYFVLSDPSNAYDGQIAITWNTSTLASGLTEAWELNFLSGGTGQPFAYNGVDTDLVPQNGWDDSTIGISGDGTVNNVLTAINADTDFSFNVYPNPASDFIVVNLSSDATLTIYNTSGSAIKTLELNSDKNTIDISNMSNGIYLLSIKLNGETKVIKIIKQ